MPAAAQPTATTPPAEPLHHLATLAEAVGVTGLADEARAFAGRVAEGRFFVACVGQFKRGKSTLLNALVGDPVLPTGVVPVTSVVTVVRYGAARRARVRHVHGDWEDVPVDRLADYVTEDGNPANQRRIAGVEVFVPHRLLAAGMCLVDTPGLGSVFTASTETTRAFLPHLDAAVIVLGADPPISAEELELVAAAAGQVTDLIVVFNKADRLSDTERTDARVFSDRVLRERLGRPVDRILDVSATERLAATGPARDWDALCLALERLAARSGANLVRAAEARGLRVLAGRLLGELDERRAALLRPLEESVARVEALRRSVAEAEDALADLHYQLAGEQDRLTRELSDRLRGFLAKAILQARHAFARSLEPCRGRGGKALREDAVRQAQGTARAVFDRWRVEEAPAAEARYRETSRRFVDTANAFLARVGSAAACDAGRVPHVLGEETGFRVTSDLRYTELLYLTAPPPLARPLLILLTRRQEFRLVSRRGADYLERLVFTNAHRVTNALIEQALESRRRLEADLGRQLHEVVRCAERALAEARARQARGHAAVEAELRRLESLRDAVAMLTPPGGL
jgi:hypothetical protein